MTRAQHRGHRHRDRKSGPKKTGPRREHIEELHPDENPPDIETFAEWDLGEEIQRAIRNMDIVKPTPIQAMAIGPVLEGKDVIAKAETGTGKTLAFGAPMIARIDPSRSTVLALVLCPTRELAQQVCDVLAALALTRGVKVALVVGGDPMQPQVAALQGGAQVVVGTPGRVLDLYQQRFLSFPWCEYAVLDEADKMFEIGFLDDIKKILSFMPDERQTLLFSATFPTEVLKLARSESKDPVEVATARGASTVESIDQCFMNVPTTDRSLVLTRMLEQSSDKNVFLVFCERRTDVDRLLRRLERLPFPVKALHGGYDQASRFRVMSAFRTGEVKALIATDVAARGLDVDHVTHVINYSVPRELEDYTHRIGRTGRAGRQGTAITFVVAEDRRRWSALTGRAKWEIEEIDVPGRSGGRREERGRGGRDTAERTSRPRRSSRDDEGAPRERGRRRDSEDAGSRERERPKREARADREQPARGESVERESSARDERTQRERPARRERAERERPERSERDRPARGEREERERPARGERDGRRDGRRGGRGSRSGGQGRSEQRREQSGERKQAEQRSPERRPSVHEDVPKDDAPFGAIRGSKGKEKREERPQRKRADRPRSKKKAGDEKPRKETPNEQGGTPGFGAGLS